MKNKLYVMCGLPASGKSYFIKNHYSQQDFWISRDDIRFSLVKEEEPYFSKERAVFKEYITQINTALQKNCGDVYADATQINFASRNKLLKNLHLCGQDIACIWLKTPIEQILINNEERAGSRSYVPPTAIYSMMERASAPDFIEGFSKIYIVEPNKPIQIKEVI